MTCICGMERILLWCIVLFLYCSFLAILLFLLKYHTHGCLNVLDTFEKKLDEMIQK